MGAPKGRSRTAFDILSIDRAAIELTGASNSLTLEKQGLHVGNMVRVSQRVMVSFWIG
jgi:hypothetical protein